MANDLVIAKYDMRSNNNIVYRAGGRENGSVRVKPEDYTLAKGVKQDHDENPDKVTFEQGSENILQEWITFTNDQKSEHDLSGYKDVKNNAKADMVVGKDGSETKASDAENPEEEGGFMGTMGGTGIGMAASCLAALAAAYMAFYSSKRVESLGKIPFCGAALSGAIFIGLGTTMLLNAIGYDKELKAREQQKSAVEGYEALVQEKEEEVTSAIDEYEEELMTQADEINANMEENTEEWLSGEDGLETLNLQLVDISAGKSDENPADIMAKLNEKQAENPVEDDIEELDNLMDQEPSSVYEKYAELGGRQEALDPVNKFLKAGKKAGAWAATIAALDFAASGLGGLAIANGWSTHGQITAEYAEVPILGEVVIGASLASTILGTVLIGIGMGLMTAAGGIMTARAVQEFNCEKGGNKLNAFTDISKSKNEGYLSDLDTRIEGAYSYATENAEAIGEKQTEGAENAFAMTIDSNEDAVLTETPGSNGTDSTDNTDSTDTPRASLTTSGNVTTSSGETIN